MCQDGWRSWDVPGKVGGTAGTSPVVALGDTAQLFPSPPALPQLLLDLPDPRWRLDLGSVTSRKAMPAAGTACPGVWLGFSEQDFRVWTQIPAFPAVFLPPAATSPQGEREQPPDQGSRAVSSCIPNSWRSCRLSQGWVPGGVPGFISRTWMGCRLGML